eukprot:90210-Prymnesium_polylepis.1
MNASLASRSVWVVLLSRRGETLRQAYAHIPAYVPRSRKGQCLPPGIRGRGWYLGVHLRQRRGGCHQTALSGRRMRAELPSGSSATLKLGKRSM